jgi:DNA-directed RNA polymerase specialized sigma24 family protein
MPAVARHLDSPHASYSVLLTHPHVRQAIWRMVRRMPRADGQDLISQSFEALWRRRDDPHLPDCIERMVGLARRVMEAKIIDYYRRRDVERSRIIDAPHVHRDDDEPPPARRSSAEQPNFVDEILPPASIDAAELLGVKQQLAVVQSCAERVGFTDDDLEIMLAVDADEVTLEEAAAAHGMAGNALRMRLLRIRRKLDQAWADHVVSTPRALMALAVRLYDRLDLRQQRAVGTRRWLARLIDKIVRGLALSL